MNVNELRTSDYLKASDLKNKQWEMTIKTVRWEDVGQDKERRAVMYFNNAHKGLVLNVTNANQIAALYGDETDNWTNCAITLYPTTTEFGGKIVPCIRVHGPNQVPLGQPPVQQVAQAAQAPANPGGNNPDEMIDDLDSDIPF